MHPFQLGGVHHVAYRCHDAQATVQWYQQMLGMDFVLAIAEDQVPSTGEHNPYMHVFLDAGGGNVLAFFELPQQPAMGRDPHTPAWVQHIAFKLAHAGALQAARHHLQAQGVDVLGPIDHGAFHSIYFFDPNGHRLELACPDPHAAALHARLDAVKWAMLDEWSRTRQAPQHARFLHQRARGTEAEPPALDAAP
jgi:catechol 2,3-dioxygenase-like lactoylglutathione lyase family enzyme